VEELTLTGAKGSAYQYIEIPNLGEKKPALSSIYIIDSEKDAAWIQAEATGSAVPSGGIADKNPADKSFNSGESFEYITILYNAKTKKNNPPDLSSHIILYRDGVELYKTEVEAMDVSNAGDYKRIPIRRKLQIEDSMQPGDYILQFLVKDKNAKENESIAAQTLSFRIIKP
jgi:hypothetical protein